MDYPLHRWSAEAEASAGVCRAMLHPVSFCCREQGKSDMVWILVCHPYINPLTHLSFSLATIPILPSLSSDMLDRTGLKRFSSWDSWRRIGRNPSLATSGLPNKKCAMRGSGQSHWALQYSYLHLMMGCTAKSATPKDKNRRGQGPLWSQAPFQALYVWECP